MAGAARSRRAGPREAGTPAVYPGRWPPPHRGSSVGVLGRVLHRCGLRGWQLHTASLSSIALCLGLWIRAKTVSQEARGNAERRALFVGLWPPMFWLIGDAVERHE